ncbi:SID1 transmembrane family member 1-like, partial [Tribolium madens]|uniref:SID1 transmembrane family member 1-like n=1 Tax=Tribolium madens TaxID=41895 RepID=UPI001CF74EC1
CLVKLYQNRHSDVTPTAYTTFSILGGTILCGTLGILFESHFIVVVLVSVVYFALSVYLFLNIYSFGAARDVLRRFFLRRRGYEDSNPVPTPNKARWWLLLIAKTINILLFTLGLTLVLTHKTDFGTFLLLILAGNAILYTLMYTIMKLIYCECGLTSIQGVIYGVLAVATWIPAGVFFFNQSSKWTESPAQSRQLNQQCIFADFFDSHDLWHFLSSLALYFTFMFLLCVDDNLSTSRTDIPLF